MYLSAHLKLFPAMHGPFVGLEASILVNREIHALARHTEYLRYHAQILAWRKAEESLRRINRGQRVPFSLFGSSRPAKDDKARDDERIRMQMTLDVEALGKDATSLGVKVEEAEAYRTLLEIATAPIAGDGEWHRSS